MNNNFLITFIFTILTGLVYSRSTESYPSSSPSLKRSASKESDEFLDDYFEDGEEDDEDWPSNEDDSNRDRRSIRYGKKTRLLLPDFAKKNSKKPTWSLDTGNVPDSLKGGSKNDGLVGVPGGPQAPTLNSGSARIPWRQVFNSAPIPDTPNVDKGDSSFGNADQQDSSFGNNDQGDSSFGNTDQGDSSFGNNDQGDSSFGNTDQGDSSFGNTDQGDSSFGNTEQGDSSFGDTEQGDSSFGNTDQGDSSFGNPDQGASSTDQTAAQNNNNDASSTGLPCTCMSILQCGASLRSTDLSDSGENPCEHDGEVCCEVVFPPSSPETPPVVPPTSHLECGLNRPLPDVKAGFLTETNALFGEAPWTVLLSAKVLDEENNGLWTYRCGGTLIHPRIVLTAAHCVKDQKLENLIVRAGDWDLSREDAEPLPFQEQIIESITFHPLYRSSYPPNDIALLLLSDPFEMADNVNTICIPAGGQTVHDLEIDLTQCVATGWGKDPTKTRQEVMKKIVLPVVPAADCQRALRTTRLGKYFKLDKSFLCAGGEFGKDVCEGDGGGPLTCPYKNSGAMVQVGVTSWGVDCGKLGIPGVFVDVVKANDWIHQAMELLVKS